MTPEERQILSNLFINLTISKETPRDPAAEKFISRSLRQKPHTAYFLAQAVLLHEKSLEIANTRIAELEAEVLRLRTEAESINKDNMAGFLNDAGLVFEGKESAMPASLQEKPHQARADFPQSLPERSLPLTASESIALLSEALKEVFGPLPTPLEEIVPEYDETAIRCYEEEFLLEEFSRRRESPVESVLPPPVKDTDSSDPA